MKKLLLLGVLGCLFSCQRPEDDVLKDENGVVTRLPHIWKSSISLDGRLNASMNAQHIYNGRYVLASERAATSGPYSSVGLCLKRVEDGQNHWVWNDRFLPDEY